LELAHVICLSFQTAIETEELSPAHVRVTSILGSLGH
jgi:hypothetical protein